MRYSAYLYPWNPFFWHGVVETSDLFETVEVNTLDGDVSPADHWRAYCKPKETAVTTAAKQSNLGRLYLDWARYPVIETTVEHNSKAAYRVRFYDLRSIHRLDGSVDLDTNLGVVMQRFGQQVHN